MKQPSNLILGAVAVLVACLQCGTATAGDGAAPAPVTKVSAALEWKDRAGAAGREEFFANLAPTELKDGAFWILFRKVEGALRPAVVVNGEVKTVGPQVTEMAELTVAITCSGGETDKRLTRVLFSGSRVLGPKVPHPDDIYCASIVTATVTERPSTAATSVPEELRARARRTLALNAAFVADADRYARENEQAFAVRTRYVLPRVLLAAEEWMEIRAEKKPASGGGGPFGTPLDEQIFGGEEPPPALAPTYSLDLCLDRIEAEGKHAVAFQTARSLFNDVLEGKIISQATGGKRRILTATTVFGQMERNRQEKGITNETIVVTGSNRGPLDRCTLLWPSARTEIAAFLTANPAAKVVIPRDPVIFFAGKNPAYGMYAWYEVEPESGRLVGVLPSGLHGASEEWAALVKILGDESLSRLKEMVGREGGPHAFFGTLAGLYVSSAGLLDAVNLVLANPELAALSDAEWKKFLADHSIAYARQFLEANADLYDSYSSRVGFWGGVAALTANFDGADAARQCLNHAWTDVKARADESAKEWLSGKHDELKTGARTALLDEMEHQFGQKGKIARELIDQVREKYNLGAEAVPDWVLDAAPHVREILRDLENPKPDPPAR